MSSINPPNPANEFANLQKIQEEGILCGDLIQYVNNLKYGDIGLFNREALGISTVVTASRAERIFIKLSQMAEMSAFKNLFTILIDTVAQQIDSRALSFRINLQPYNSNLLEDDVIQPPRSLYDQDLRLGRPLLNEMMAIASPIFVPENSPIALYLNGLLLTYTYQQNLNPFEIMHPDRFINSVDRIVMWSPKLIANRSIDDRRFTHERILLIPNDRGEYDEYTLGNIDIKILIIVTANTGAISELYFDFLKTFFVEKHVSFLFPELMVIMNRHILPLTTQIDVLCHEQVHDVVVGLPNRRVTLAFGDTVAGAIGVYNVPQKLKCLFPISEVHHRDIILRAMVNEVTPVDEFQIGSWQSWAYGIDNGQSLRIHNENVELDERQIPPEDQVVSKLNLGLVNMNNEMDILCMPEYITTPALQLDFKRVYVGIYTDP